MYVGFVRSSEAVIVFNVCSMHVLCWWKSSENTSSVYYSCIRIFLVCKSQLEVRKICSEVAKTTILLKNLHST